jgi:hypothetical protein
MATKKLTNTSNISNQLTGNTGHYWGTCNSGNIGICGGTTTLVFLSSIINNYTNERTHYSTMFRHIKNRRC